MKLGSPLDQIDSARKLAAAGLALDSSARKAKLLAGSARAMTEAGASAEADIAGYFVPGRIEVLGKHTDYAGGRSLLVAADRGFCLLAAPRRDATVTMIDTAWQQRAQFEITPDLAPAARHWSNYPMTVARRLARNFGPGLRGADIAFASDLPAASGMSSSSALLVATFLALAGVNRLSHRDEYRRNITGPETLAEYLGTVENGQSFGTLAGDKGVGTFGGSEDHTAMLCCGPDTMSQYSYCPVRFERRIKLPEGYTFAVAFSGVVAEKTGSALDKYNRASALAAAVAQAWRDATGRSDRHIAAALGSGPDAVNRIRQVLANHSGGAFPAADLLKRFEHFYAENEQIIPAAGDALASGDLARFGRQVDLSQEHTETLLGNQVPETVFLARSARELGAAAASAFGAGFGGSVWAMVESRQAEQFLPDWSHRYHGKFPGPAAQAKFFATQAGPAVFELK